MSNLNNQFTNAISNLNLNAQSNAANNPTNVILQTLKRRNTKVVVPLDERVTLEKAYGFTITSNSRLTQSCDGTIAYLAGCVIVLYDRNKLNQDFIISHARKTLTTLAFSADGRCLATGESGHEPKVRVWDVKDKIQLCEFGGHKFSIECVCFSTNLQSNLIVSIGSIHDMVVNVWNLKTKFKVASNKIACKVKGIAFTRDGSIFVTVGNRHVKYWYLTVSSLMETVPLKGRAAILGDMRNSYFCDVICGTGECVHSTFTITTTGMLCEFNNEQRCITQQIDLRTDHAYCIYADNKENLFIGCSNGSILIFRQKDLGIVASLPRPHCLGVDISKGLDTRHIIENLGNHELKYPDCVALCYDSYECIISAIYNDHSFYVWDIKDLNKVKKIDSHLFHSSCCWSLDTFSSALNSSQQQSQQPLNLPIDSFITCSSDNTVRIWSSNTTTNTVSSSSSMLKRNIYSKELLKVIYIDNDLSALCEIDPSSENSEQNQNPNQQSVQQSVSNSVTNLPVGSVNNLNVNNNELANNLKMGARCLKISPFGKHLATGDRNGNIRITDLSTLESIALIEAHDGEVLYLQYSQPESNRLLLASSSRDRLIHIFDASRNTYDLLQTLDDHSAAITAVRFCFNQIEKQLYIISCGADKSIMFRTATSTSETGGSLTSSGVGSSSSSTVSSSSSSPNFNNTTNSVSSSQFQFVRTSYVAEKQTFYDLNLDPARNYIYTISQDRIIRTYSIKDGKKLRQFRGSLNEDGYLLKMDIDRNGSLLATSCTDKCVYIWDINTTECVAYLCGHSEVVTDLKFTSDNQHLITVSADGCIFLWKLNNLLNYNPYASSSNIATPTCTSSMTANDNNGLPWSSCASSRKQSNYSSSSSSSNIAQLNQLESSKYNSNISNQLSLDNIFDSDTEQLPAWARNKLINHSVGSSIDNAMASIQDSDIVVNENKPNDINYDQPRRGRAVWGPVLDASLSFMVDNENQSMISSPNSFLIEDNNDQNNLSWMEKEEIQEELEIEDSSYDSVHTTLIHTSQCEEQQPSPTASTVADENENLNDKLIKNSNIIQFPSPCVDKDVFLVKQLNQLNIKDSSSTLASVRKSWICPNNEEDLLFSLMNKKQENISFESTTTENDQISTPTQIKEANDDDTIKPENKSFDFSSSFLSNGSPLSRTHSLLNDTTIKLDCDLENSFRRQSISARYLMRTQQQQHQQILNKSFETENKIQSPTYSSSSSSSSTHSSPHLKKDLINKPPPSPTSTSVSTSEYLTNKESEEIDLELVSTNNSTNNKNATSNPINITQMAADLMKMRRKAAQLTTHHTNTTNVNNNGNKLLYSHHTESSLNKTKPKQVVQSQSNLKRSPSVNSIMASSNAVGNTGNNNENLLSTIAIQKNALLNIGGDSSASSSSSSIKLNGKPKSSPKQSSSNSHALTTTITNNVNHTVSNNSNNSEENNLKKAVSMITLFSNQQSNSTKIQSKPQGNSSQKVAINNTLPNAQISTHQHQLNQQQQQQQLQAQISNNLLPPKTVRQVKQRSAERQLTSSSILSNVNSISKPPSTAPIITSNIAANTFNEQKKHLRKLSNSIQNLHHVVASASVPSTSSVDLSSTTGVVVAAVNAFNKLNNLLPPQPPKSSSAKSSPSQPNRTELKQLSTSINLDLSTSHHESENDTHQSINGNNKAQDNEKQQCSSSNSLISSSSSSSSSSSCSLFDNVSSISSSTTGSELKVEPFISTKSDESNNTKLKSFSNNNNDSIIKTSFNSRFNENASSGNSILNNSNNFANTTSLKKPITFASIAAAANSGISSPSPITSHMSSPQPSKFTSYNNSSSPLSSNKIESIIDEFKKNIYILQLVSNQTPKIAEDLSKFHPNSVGLQSSAIHQTIQLMQTFNSTVQSLVYKLNSSLNAIKISNVVQQQTSLMSSNNELNTSSSNSESIKLDTDLEIS